MDSVPSAALVAVAVGVSIALQWALGSSKSAAKQQNTRTSLHLNRKVQHAGTGILFVAVLELGFPLRLASLLLLGSAAGFMALHAARLRYPWVQWAFLEAFSGIMRDHEKDQLPGAAYFLVGCGLVASVASLPVTVMSVLAISLGDPVASAAGILLKPHCSRKEGEASKHMEVSVPGLGAVSLWREKSVIGSAACAMAVAASLAAYLTLLAQQPVEAEETGSSHAWISGWSGSELVAVQEGVAAALAAGRGLAWPPASVCGVAAVAGLAAALAEAIEVEASPTTACEGGAGSWQGFLLFMLRDDNVRVPIATAAVLAAMGL